jgi:hypothetical protein
VRISTALALTCLTLIVAVAPGRAAAAVFSNPSGGTVVATPIPAAQQPSWFSGPDAYWFPVSYGETDECTYDGFRFVSTTAEGRLADGSGGFSLIYPSDFGGPEQLATAPVIHAYFPVTRGDEPSIQRAMEVRATCGLDPPLGTPFQHIQLFYFTITFGESPGGGGPTGPAPGGGTTPAPGGGQTGKQPKPKKRGILSDKSKRNLAQAAQRLLGYANNAEAVANACALGGIKKAALKASLKAVARDLAVSQLPIVSKIPTDPCSMALGAFTGILRLEALGFVKLAQDPPRERYRTRVKARVRVPIAVRPTRRASRPVAASLSKAIAQSGRARAYLAALLVANERLQGAQKARDRRWTKIHRKSAIKFARAAATATAALQKLGVKLASQLGAAGYRGTLTAQRLDMAAAGGLSKRQDALLRVLGVSARDRRAVREGLKSAVPGAESVPDAMREAATSLAGMAGMLRALR